MVGQSSEEPWVVTPEELDILADKLDLFASELPEDARQTLARVIVLAAGEIRTSEGLDRAFRSPLGAMLGCALDAVGETHRR